MDNVAPFTGAWIEINSSSIKHQQAFRSRPSRARGLKFNFLHYKPPSTQVAPFTGAWIEIGSCVWLTHAQDVAPFTGAWIEILERIERISL